MSVLDNIAARFVSGNSVPVERAYITAEEFSELRKMLQQLRTLQSPQAVPSPEEVERVAEEVGIQFYPDGIAGNCDAAQLQAFAQAFASPGVPEGYVMVPDKGYKPDGPVGMALTFLEAALNCKSFVWDFDQHEAAMQTLADAKAMLSAAPPQPTAGTEGEKE